MTEVTRTILDAAAEHLPAAHTYPLPGLEHLIGVVEHTNSKFRIEDIEKHLPEPLRIRQGTTFETPKAFTDYVRDYSIEGTRLFASLRAMKVVASIDYHVGAAEPSWRSHNATYPATFAPAFAAWHAAHGKPMPQQAFGEFLQDRAEDATGEEGFPAPADLMEVAQNFEAVRNVDFRSAINLATNERGFRYEEKDSVGGTVQCPKVIRLFLPVFQGCDPTHVGVRLAYNIDNGKLVFTVKVHRLEELLDAEFTRLCDAIAVDLPGVPLHRGSVA